VKLFHFGFLQFLGVLDFPLYKVESFVQFLDFDFGPKSSGGLKDVFGELSFLLFGLDLKDVIA